MASLSRSPEACFGALSLSSLIIVVFIVRLAMKSFDLPRGVGFFSRVGLKLGSDGWLPLLIVLFCFLVRIVRRYGVRTRVGKSERERMSQS